MEMENTQASRIKIKTIYLEAALEYSEAGFNIFPVKAGSKTPIVSWKDFQSRKVSHEEIIAWWSKYRDAGIAAIMGKVSGNIAAVDIDPRNGGLESMKKIYLPDTRIHKTGGNGFHYFYGMPDAARKKTGIYPGIDFIGEGGYCIMPPSIHESGQRYTVLNALPIREAPEWLIKMADENVLPDKPEIIPLGERHASLLRSIRGYANDSRRFFHLWKRACALVMKCAEPSQVEPFTEEELFKECLWTWNKAHPNEIFTDRVAKKLLVGRAKRRGDIIFSGLACDISFLSSKDLTPNIQ